MAKTKKKTKKLSAWEKANAYPVVRCSPFGTYIGEIDRGVNFFVLMLEQLGAQPEYSCEGHPAGFYVLFSAPYELARKIWAAGYFSVEIEGDDRWSIRCNFTDNIVKAEVLTAAAAAWERIFGPLKANLKRRVGRRDIRKSGVHMGRGG